MSPFAFPELSVGTNLPLRLARSIIALTRVAQQDHAVMIAAGRYVEAAARERQWCEEVLEACQQAMAESSRMLDEAFKQLTEHMNCTVHAPIIILPDN